MNKIIVALFVSLNLLLSCKAREFNTISGTENILKNSEKKGIQTNITQKKLTFDSYLNACALQFGVPKISFPKIDCTQGAQVLTYSRGKPIAFDQFQTEMKCENPSLGSAPDEACRPHSWIGYTEKDGITWSYLCAQTSEAALGSPQADNVQLIAYHGATGATCFFESKEDAATGMNIKEIPKLQEDLGKTFWKTPLEMAKTDGSDCVSCHSGNPWLQSSHLSRLSKPDAKKFVPTQGHTSSNIQIPYWVVAHTALEQLSLDKSWTPKRLGNEVAPSCTGCHSIGDKNYCRSLAPFSMGQVKVQWHAFEDKSFEKVFAHKLALPKLTNQKVFEASTESKHLQEVLKCCEPTEANKLSCNWRPLSQSNWE
jgi:hypothetical protein